MIKKISPVIFFRSVVRFDCAVNTMHFIPVFQGGAKVSSDKPATASNEDFFFHRVIFPE